MSPEGSFAPSILTAWESMVLRCGSNELMIKCKCQGETRDQFSCVAQLMQHTTKKYYIHHNDPYDQKNKIAIFIPMMKCKYNKK